MSPGFPCRRPPRKGPLPRPAGFQTSERRFPRRIRWDTRVMAGILVLSAVLALGGAVVWIALLLWAAREDGRDQERRDQLRRRRDDSLEDRPGRRIFEQRERGRLDLVLGEQHQPCGVAERDERVPARHARETAGVPGVEELRDDALPHPARPARLVDDESAPGGRGLPEHLLHR